MLPTPTYFDITNMIEQIKENGYEIVKIPRNIVKSYETGTIRCKAKHTFTFRFEDAVGQCKICFIAGHLKHKAYALTNFEPLMTEYDSRTEQFPFRCPVGHSFVCKYLPSGRYTGCPACALQIRMAKSGVRISVGKQITVVSNNTDLRIKCLQDKHNPDCKDEGCLSTKLLSLTGANYKLGCKDFIPCGAEFYSSINEFKNIKPCGEENAHFATKSYWHLVVPRYVLESHFDTPFDDTLSFGDNYYETNGYCEKLKIAILCVGDTRTLVREKNTLRNACKYLGINLIEIPKFEFHNVNNICLHLFTELAKLKLVEGDKIYELANIAREKVSGSIPYSTNRI